MNATIQLTDDQIETLQPLFAEVKKGWHRTHGHDKEQRYAILGQCWSPEDMVHEPGSAKFWLLNTEQYMIVNEALERAMRLPK